MRSSGRLKSSSGAGCASLVYVCTPAVLEEDVEEEDVEEEATAAALSKLDSSFETNDTTENLYLGGHLCPLATGDNSLQVSPKSVVTWTSFMTLLADLSLPPRTTRRWCPSTPQP